MLPISRPSGQLKIIPNIDPSLTGDFLRFSLLLALSQNGGQNQNDALHPEAADHFLAKATQDEILQALNNIFDHPLAQDRNHPMGEPLTRKHHYWARAVVIVLAAFNDAQTALAAQDALAAQGLMEKFSREELLICVWQETEPTSGAWTDLIPEQERHMSFLFSSVLECVLHTNDEIELYLQYIQGAKNPALCLAVLDVLKNGAASPHAQEIPKDLHEYLGEGFVQSNFVKEFIARIEPLATHQKLTQELSQEFEKSAPSVKMKM